MEQLSYKEAVDYILGIPRFTKKNTLENTRALLRALGAPQDQMKIIHVAGTNGKGSVSSYIDSVLREAGRSVGLFTSPHLVSIRERFRLNGEITCEADFVRAFGQVCSAIQEILVEGYAHPTFFEFLFGMAMVLFRQGGTEYAVLETGLGGRFDATNSIEQPCLCVITSISLDHTEYLGDTVAAIAAEKAGIIKHRVPLVYDGRDERSAAVLRMRARELDAPAVVLQEDDITILQKKPKGIDFSLHNGYYENTRFHISNPAAYQTVNASLAVLALDELFSAEQKLPVEMVQNGIRRACWPARMQEVLPGVFIDGAHNEAAALCLRDTVQELSGDKLLLFAAAGDKKYKDMIQILCDGIAWKEVIITRVDNPRAADEDSLGKLFEGQGAGPVRVFSQTEQAFAYAYDRKKEGLLICAGSLFLAGELLELIRRSYDD